MMAGRARRYECSPSRVHIWLSSVEIFSRRQSICRCPCAPDVRSNLPKRNENKRGAANGGSENLGKEELKVLRKLSRLQARLLNSVG